jgi:hypothetical protein
VFGGATAETVMEILNCSAERPLKLQVSLMIVQRIDRRNKRRVNRMTEHISITQGRKILRENALEADVTSAVRDYLKAQRIPHSLTNAERSFNNKGQWVRRISPGWPDITGCLPPTGHMLAVECKRGKGGKLRWDQACCLHMLWQAGAIICIPRSVDDLIETLAARKTLQRTLDEIAKRLAEGPPKKKAREKGWWPKRKTKG